MLPSLNKVNDDDDDDDIDDAGCLFLLRALIGSLRCLFSLLLAKGNEINVRSARHIDRMGIFSKSETRTPSTNLN